MAWTNVIFSDPPFHHLSCAQVAFPGSKEWIGLENRSRLKINKNKIIILNEEQFTSPAHLVAINNFSDTIEGTEQAQEWVACGWWQQDTGTT